jgi:hypothetical protein
VAPPKERRKREEATADGADKVGKSTAKGVKSVGKAVTGKDQDKDKDKDQSKKPGM